MDTTRPPRILLLVNDAELARRSMLALQGTAHVSDDPSVSSDAPELDVVVIDAPLNKELLRTRYPLLGHGQFGLIALGKSDDADVQLSTDASNSEIILACALLAEIVRLRRQQAQAAQNAQTFMELAATDPLTGLLNRQAWDELFPARFQQAAVRSAGLCLALVDLDQFKAINDRFGHPTGDLALQAAARALKNAVRKEDVLARLGGDEFTLLLSNVAAGDAASVVERIRASLTPALSAVASQPITASAGLAMIGGNAQFATPAELLAAADEALRTAKTRGRDRTEQC